MPNVNAPLIVVQDSDGNRPEAGVMQQIWAVITSGLTHKDVLVWFRPTDLTPEFILWRKMNRPQNNEHRFSLFYKQL